MSIRYWFLSDINYTCTYQSLSELLHNFNNSLFILYHPPTVTLSFTNQFAFQLTGSPTAAVCVCVSYGPCAWNKLWLIDWLITLLHTVTNLHTTNHYAITLVTGLQQRVRHCPALYTPFRTWPSLTYLTKFITGSLLRAYLVGHSHCNWWILASLLK